MVEDKHQQIYPLMCNNISKDKQNKVPYLIQVSHLWKDVRHHDLLKHQSRVGEIHGLH